MTTAVTATTTTRFLRRTSTTTQNVQDLLLSIFGDPKTTTETNEQQEEMVMKKQSGFMPTPLILAMNQQKSKNSPNSEEGEGAGLEEGKTKNNLRDHHLNLSCIYHFSTSITQCQKNHLVHHSGIYRDGFQGVLQFL